jgi:GT2 family glycosyltransferase
MSDLENKAVAKKSGAKPDVVATWLSQSLLLAVGSTAVSPGDGKATLLAGDKSVEVPVRCMSLGGANGAAEHKVLTAAIPDDSRTALTGRPLAIDGGGGGGEAGAIEFTDLPSILEHRLSGLDEAASRRVIEFVSAAPVAHGLGADRDLVLNTKLHNLRNALRHRLPVVVIDGDQALTGNIDTLIPIDDSAFFVKGWMRDGEAPVTRLTAVTPEGERVQLLDLLHRLDLWEITMFENGPYADAVDATRFVAHFKTAGPSPLRKPWIFEIQNETGRLAEMHQLPAVSTDIRAARTSVLRSVPAQALPDQRLMTEHIHPAVERLQERARDAVKIETIANLGDLSDAPDISIVVPLYKRIDLVDHQLLQFDRDPEFQAQELIYVLDSPELDREFANRARQLSRLYRVPFRVVTMAENVGFGAATHAGVSIARGRLLVLLNSDVLPAEPGWLGRMQAFYDSTPNIGALGPKLLYEDDSLQHAGLYFGRIPEGPTAGCWANMHYFKGLHKDLPAANVARPVPAVTAACLMIEQDLYYRAGGLPDVYVQGDCEDSEICLRLLAEGRENWYLPGVELYHLEGRSYSDAERGITVSYNHWLQTWRLGREIEDAMARYPGI